MKKQELEKENAFLKYLLSRITEVAKRDIFVASDMELFETVVGVQLYTNDYEEFLLKGKLPESNGLY